MEKKLKSGDRVLRIIGGKIPMNMLVRKIENGLIYCEAVDSPGWKDDELWTFEEGTWVEYDPDLKWGSKYGATGSYLTLIG
jgi:phage baseplate assembly protein gpV